MWMLLLHEEDMLSMTTTAEGDDPSRSSLVVCLVVEPSVEESID